MGASLALAPSRMVYSLMANVEDGLMERHETLNQWQYRFGSVRSDPLAIVVEVVDSVIQDHNGVLDLHSISQRLI
ncbi:hypothetical protein E2542_SST07801 [Spatholobus suberectus]|nr:hypothetical protein E2542_SST07801 [Spatholobus suberectus]